MIGMIDTVLHATATGSGLLGELMRLEILPLENQQVQGTYSHAAVSNVEDGTEKYQRIPALARNPVRPCGIDYRE